MSIYRERKVGSWVIDRAFRGVGRVKKATGSDLQCRAQKLDDMLTELYDQDRLDVLKAIKAGVVSLTEVYAAWKTGDRKRLPTIEGCKPLKATADAWVDRADCSEGHRRNHRQAFMLLLEGEPAGATLADLPQLLKAYKYRARGKVTFNRVRASMLSFLRDELGRRNRLYEDVADITGFTEKPAPGVKLSVEDFRAVAEGLGAYGSMAWALVLTGMRRGEYWGDWEVLPDRYRVRGTKTKGSVRDVPYLGPIIRPMVQYQAFRRKLGKVRPGVTPHDFRHTYMHWMEGAGISRTRRKIYLGHGSGDVSAIYERHEIDGFLKSDAKLLLDYIGPVGGGLRLVG